MDQTERMIQIKGGEMGSFFQRNGKLALENVISNLSGIFDYWLFQCKAGQQSQQNQDRNQNREHKQNNWQNKQSTFLMWKYELFEIK